MHCCRALTFASARLSCKRSHKFVSACESVGVGSDGIGSNNKRNVRFVVRSKFAGVISLNY